jgi:hypothetical protein
VDSFYRGVAIAGAIVVVASVLLTIVRLQGERPFSSLSALLAGAGAAGSLAVYILMLDIALKDAAVVGLLIGGGVLGALVGLKIPLHSRDGIVFSKAAGWHLAPPGLAVAAFQIAAVRGSMDGVILSMAALYAATALAIAASVCLLLRRAAAAPVAKVAEQPIPAQPAATEAIHCPNCGTVAAAGHKFCRGCGRPLPGTG